MPLSFIFAVGVFAATADLVLRQLRWRRNSTAAFSPPVLSPPPSPPESGGGLSVEMTSFDDNNETAQRDGEIAQLVQMGFDPGKAKTWGDMGRYGEEWGDVGRYGEE